MQVNQYSITGLICVVVNADIIEFVVYISDIAFLSTMLGEHAVSGQWISAFSVKFRIMFISKNISSSHYETFSCTSGHRLIVGT